MKSKTIKKAKHFLAPLLVCFVSMVLVKCGVGCGAEADAYSAELSACVVNAKTREEADSCRAGVNAKYGVCESPDYPRLQPCPPKN